MMGRSSGRPRIFPDEPGGYTVASPASLSRSPSARPPGPCRRNIPLGKGTKGGAHLAVSITKFLPHAHTL
jgi:hypothetical protein